jgi:hypothetical protein
MNIITIIFLFIPMSTLAAGKHALLIAIQDYSKTTFNSLSGPANDLKLTEGVLRERFGFVEHDFIILKDEKATHSGIEKAFNVLSERVKPNDFVYIFYSGHGSQTKDLNGDEPYDQTWVSYGARTGRQGIDNYDVLDDEIDKWLSNLYEKTQNVVFISDSCHSATVTRGAAATSRAIEEDKRPHLLGKRSYQPLKTHYGIHIGAARDNESAIELAQKDGQSYSLFTWYWTQNLQQAQAGETWNDVFKRTYAQVTMERGMAQHPQIEGEHRKQVLGPGFSTLSPTIPIIRIVSKRRVKIKAGSLAGVTKDSVYRLYNSPEDSPRLKIYHVTPFASYAKAESKGEFKIGDLVVEETHAYHFTPFKVYLGADFYKDKPLLRAITTGFDALEAYQLTNNPHQANLQLYLLHPFANQDGQLIYASPDDALPKSFPNQPPELWILTPDQRLFKKGLKIPFSNLKEGVKLLQDILKKMARIRELKQLKSPRGSTLPVSVQISLLSPDNSCLKGPNCVQLSDYDLGWYRKTGSYFFQEIDGRTLSQGKILSLSFFNKSEQDYYCYLINIGPDGAIQTLFPPYWEQMEFARVKKGEKGEKAIILEMEQVGEETFKLITSRQPIDVSLLEQPARGDGLNPLEQLLFNAAQRNDTSIEIDEWATEQVTFKVQCH